MYVFLALDYALSMHALICVPQSRSMQPDT